MASIAEPQPFRVANMFYSDPGLPGINNRHLVPRYDYDEYKAKHLHGLTDAQILDKERIVILADKGLPPSAIKYFKSPERREDKKNPDNFWEHDMLVNKPLVEVRADIKKWFEKSASILESSKTKRTVL